MKRPGGSSGRGVGAEKRTGGALLSRRAARRFERPSAEGPHRVRAGQLLPGVRARMIRLENISKQNGHQILFIEASATLLKGEKIGLVGP